VGRVNARRIDCTGPEDSHRGSGIVKAVFRTAVDDQKVVASGTDHQEGMVEDKAPRAEDHGLSPPSFARLCACGDM
jgi:hypothetical protein